MTAADRLAGLDPAARGAALAALDEISRPLDLREIDAALYGHLSRRDRRALLRGLSGFDIVAIHPKPVD